MAALLVVGMLAERKAHPGGNQYLKRCDSIAFLGLLDVASLFAAQPLANGKGRLLS